MALDVDVRDASSKAVKNKSVSVRFPVQLYDGLEAIATSTGRSVNAVFEDAFHYYVVHYVESDEYLRRVDRYQQIYDESLAKADEARVQGKAYRWSPPRAPESGLVPAVGSPNVRATVVRVDPDTHMGMQLASKALGVSINDIMIEAARLWVDDYPSFQDFRDKARGAVQHLANALSMCGALDLLTDYDISA